MKLTIRMGLMMLAAWPAAAWAQGPDATKRVIERGAERMLDVAAAVERAGKVPPGRVAWHRDLAAAQDAARVSGKPVLLFQLLGQLDEGVT